MLVDERQGGEAEWEEGMGWGGGGWKEAPVFGMVLRMCLL